MTAQTMGRLGAWQVQLVAAPTARLPVTAPTAPQPTWAQDQGLAWRAPVAVAPPPAGQPSPTAKAATSAANEPLGDLSQLGPHRVRKTTIALPTRDGGSTEADVYLPVTDRPSAPVLHAYGMLQNPGRYAGTATHYASWGLTVIVPKLPNPSGAPIANGQEIQGFVDAIMQRPAALGPHLDTSRGVGLSGHSFGALTVLLGAGGARNVGAVVAMDPADNLGQGKLNGHKIQAPTAFIVGRAEIFNQFGNGFPIHDRIRHPNKEMIRVQGASHMDFQNERTSGPKNRENAVAMKFATAFLLHQLQGDPRAAAWTMEGPGVQEARRRGEIR